MPDRVSVAVRVRGLVQGVGFRPTVWRIATDVGLIGDVSNDGQGVLIRLKGRREEIDTFIVRLRSEAPPISRIDSISENSIEDFPDTDFKITHSKSGDIETGITPDAAPCLECLQEIHDANNRRYRYAFTNCTHCGPRLSIVRGIPYDRKNTSMDDFTMCEECQAEYDNPVDRRFHAQPNACPACGPKVWLQDGKGALLGGDDPIREAARLIKQGAIIAIKGLGGFQLACDATSEAIVDKLRQRKKRFDKPFALLASKLAMVEAYAEVSEEAASLITSFENPIVILNQKKPLASGIAPDQDSLGFMLPSTPLHHLLMADIEVPVVLTSGNRSDEPQVIDNNESLIRLEDIADYWLMHDRDIINRLDDSVVYLAGKEQKLTLRRARGLSPAPMLLPKGFDGAPPILAMGAELKNTFCVLNNGQAILSQHMGDMENPATHADYRKNMKLYESFYAFKPEAIATDCHPDYLSTQWGHALAADGNIPVVSVQHHHAHIAASMAEYGLAHDHGKVLGIAMDGLGYGEDGSLWGGEFLLADYVGFERLAQIDSVALPGGMKAMIEPWRNAYAHLVKALGKECFDAYASLPTIAALKSKPIDQLDKMLSKGLNSPPASSMGRLFDAVAALLGLHADRTSYEGQAAIALESQAKTHGETVSPYPVAAQKIITWEALWVGILDDLKAGKSRPQIAARFHQTLVTVLTETAKQLARQSDFTTIVLSGGVFQNAMLRENLRAGLEDAGYCVLVPQNFPVNDGGIALGQAVIAAAQHRRKK